MQLPPNHLSDKNAEKLLELIYSAVTEYGGVRANMTLQEFVEDVAMSMQPTTDRADLLRKEIETNLER
jgi:hypothetical protein